MIDFPVKVTLPNLAIPPNQISTSTPIAMFVDSYEPLKNVPTQSVATAKIPKGIILKKPGKNIKNVTSYRN